MEPLGLLGPLLVATGSFRLSYEEIMRANANSLQVFSTLRVYALLGQNGRVALVAFVLGMIPTCLQAVRLPLIFLESLFVNLIHYFSMISAYRALST